MSSIERVLSGILSDDPSLGDLVRPRPGERRVLRWIGARDRARGLAITSVEVPGRSGTLWAGPTPGRRDWSKLEEQLEGLREAGVHHLVCLLSKEDLIRLDRQAPFRASLRAHFGDHLCEVPMRPDGLPASLRAFEEALRRADEALFAGHDVLAHCGAGCGRTGTFCCCLLVRAGFDTTEAVAAFRARRRCGPETAAQVALVEWIRQNDG